MWGLGAAPVTIEVVVNPMNGSLTFAAASAEQTDSHQIPPGRMLWVVRHLANFGGLGGLPASWTLLINQSLTGLTGHQLELSIQMFHVKH